jgi:prolycopene isomerase
VVGAGGGGLSAAAVLAQAGIDVVVLERHHRVGGMMVSFTRGDYRFEASLHGFDGLDEVEGFNTPIFEDLDLLGRVSPIRSDPMYRVVFPDLTFEVPADIDEYRRRLQERFPHESENLDALFAELADFQRIFVGAIHYQETGELPEDVTEEDLLRFEEMMSITLDQFLLPYISDPELLALLTQLTGFAGNRPGDISALLFMAMWNSYHRGGYFYFDGGSQALTDAMAQVIIENGGAIEVNTEVTRIEVADGRATRVRTRDNRCFDAQYVISNVPAPVTILELVGREHWPEWYVESVEGMEEGGAPFVVFLGVDHDYTSEFGGTHELFTAATIDQEQSQQAMLTCDPALLPLGISNYSVVEPDVAPPGKNAITLTTLVPWECRDEWGWNDSHQTYREVKDEFARLLVERVDQEYLPGLVSHVEVMEVATPQTIWAFTLSPAGSMVGWDNTPAQTMTNRLPQETPIENLFLVGAWTFPGGGQSTVMNSGRSAARLVITAEEGAR